MYGSLVNRLQERMVIGAPAPAIGMGVTMTSYSDRHAGTIIKIEKTGKSLLIHVQQDNVKRDDEGSWYRLNHFCEKISQTAFDQFGLNG